MVTLKVKQILLSIPRQVENKLTVHHLQVLQDPAAWTPSSSWKVWLQHRERGAERAGGVRLVMTKELH